MPMLFDTAVRAILIKGRARDAARNERAIESACLAIFRSASVRLAKIDAAEERARAVWEGMSLDERIASQHRVESHNKLSTLPPAVWWNGYASTDKRLQAAGVRFGGLNDA